MQMYWVYDLPNWLFGTLTIAAFVAFSLAGQAITRPLWLRLFGRHPHSDIVSYYLAAVGVFYGITLGLIAVGTYTTYSQVDDVVSQEAAAVAAIYRDVSTYPEPARTAMRSQVEHYVDYTIDKAWPLQERGIVEPGDEALTELQTSLADFEPRSDREKILQAEALREFNTLITLQRMRVASVKSGLPPTMYAVVLIGAVLNMAVGWLFVVDKRGLHRVLNGLMAALLGLLVFLIAAMDNPFRGEFSVGPDAFVDMRAHLMQHQTPPVSKR